MAEVWREDRELTVREVMDGINARAPQQRAYTTFMTIMRRLATKGLLERRREGKADFYVAVWSEAGYRAARVQADTSAMIEQYGDAALVAFASAVEGVDPARRRLLRKLARDA
ncbi:BlaI/MecI/CopY family transcriptional regulator [Paraconexibacter antarcticus]|uniref:BlaI/MecI/CopY family transcriptional regulator n=2 Tax=Paraconexibacter antarcticus TaxID=2949664 RepID=A0ABY5DPN2_9ACTN|nr:BlaI/MecI/CopY family transcriptional regulator [Paraconexibacter antarcticus]